MGNYHKIMNNIGDEYMAVLGGVLSSSLTVTEIEADKITAVRY